MRSQHLILISTLMFALALAAGCQNDQAINSALDHAINYTGFQLNWLGRFAAYNSAELVAVKGTLEHFHGDTNKVFAWRFEFKNVALPDFKGEYTTRDYEVFIDASTGYLLEIRSPITGDTVYNYDYEREGYPAIREGCVPDTGIITFAEALKPCIQADPLTAKKIAAAIVYAGPIGESLRAWEILSVGIARAPVLSLVPPPADSPEATEQLKRPERTSWRARTTVNALTGEVSSGSFTGTRDDSTQ